jgi:hypothetical protein
VWRGDKENYEEDKDFKWRIKHVHLFLLKIQGHKAFLIKKFNFNLVATWSS